MYIVYSFPTHWNGSSGQPPCCKGKWSSGRWFSTSMLSRRGFQQSWNMLVPLAASRSTDSRRRACPKINMRSMVFFRTL